MSKARKGHRKHTPIVSKAQQRLFGAVVGGSLSLPGLSKQKAIEHLKEAEGKMLPKRTTSGDKRPLIALKAIKKRKSVIKGNTHGMVDGTVWQKDIRPVRGITHADVTGYKKF